MRHAFLAPLLALLSFLHPSANAYTRMVDTVSSSVVRITGEMEFMTLFGPMKAEYTCSGFVVAHNRVLTAAHCIGDKMTVDGVAGAVVMKKSDESTDLALLDVDTDKQALEFSDAQVQRFDDVTALGYGFGFTRLTVLKVRVMLVDYVPQADMAPMLITQGAYIGGMSGGPVVNTDGQVVGIVQEEADSAAGLGVGTLIIRAFMLGV